MQKKTETAKIVQKADTAKSAESTKGDSYSYDTFINPGLSLQRFFFELTRYGTCHVSLVPSASSLNNITPVPEQICVHYVWSYPCRSAQMICEKYMPEITGIIECSYSEDDLYAPREIQTSAGETIASTIDWVDKVILSVSSQPDADPLNPPSPDNGGSILSELDQKSGSGISEESSGDRKNDDSSKKTEEKDKEKPAVEQTYTDSNGNLRRFSYGKEQFAVNDVDGTRTLVSTAESNITRKTFDQLLRLVKKENYTLGTDARSTVLDSIKTYTYNGDFPSAESAEEELPGKKIINNFKFDENGHVVVSESSHYEDDKTDKDDKNKKQILLPDFKIVWAYDEKNRIVAEQKTLFKYTIKSNGKRKTQKSTTKAIYDYTDKGPLPDSSFYEDDKLRIKTVYEDKATYTETMYFDGGISVESYYEHGIKKTESILKKGKVQRRTEF